ncbi:MAG: PLP-dependent transferase [Bacteroidota bacterium]
MSHTYAKIHDTNNWHKLVRPNTKILIVETPSNPAIDLLDLAWLGEFTREHDLILVVDNCFATPYLQQPIAYGADLVLHSATKYIDGQGRVLGGLIAGRKELVEELKVFARHAGPALSPFNSWVLSKSLETLALRMDKHCQNALQVAEWLHAHPEVDFVKYPFHPSHPQFDLAKRQMRAGGGVLSFQIKGGLERGRQFLDSLKMASLSANLGDSRTIATHPASTTHRKLTVEQQAEVGITPGLIRISVGLEHPQDIIKDLEQAFEHVYPTLPLHT